MPLVLRGVLCAMIVIDCFAASRQARACDDRFPPTCALAEEAAVEESTPIFRSKPRMRVRAVPFPPVSPLRGTKQAEASVISSPPPAAEIEKIEIQKAIEDAFEALASSHRRFFEFRLRARGEVLQVKRLLESESDHTQSEGRR